MGFFRRILSWPEVQLVNPALLGAMRRDIETSTPEAEAAVYRELLRARFLVPVVSERDAEQFDDHPDGSDGDDLALIAFVDEERRTVVLAFTDVEAARAWNREDTCYALLDQGDLFRLAQRNRAEGIVLNPEGPMRMELTRDEVEALAEGEIPETAAE
jgi:hypothetical protein